MKPPTPSAPATYRAWAAHLAQALDDLIDQSDPDRDDSATAHHRDLLARFDHWHLEQQGQNPLRFDPPSHRPETRHARS